jgi:flagellar motility protein MotE (MotC chaperone)
MSRIYHFLALIALINLFAIAGLVGYLFASGRLSTERVDQIAKVMRGEFPASQPASSQPASAPAPAEPSRAEIERVRVQREYYELVSERHLRELEDRERLNQTIQLDVSRKLEEIEKEKAMLAQQRRQIVQQGEQGGFAQMVELYSGMEPAKAKDLLKNHTKEADAAAVLSKMDENRAKKIFNACKTADEMLWLGRILGQIRQAGEPGAGVDGPKPASTEK